jgi:hypothetical protein
MAANLTTAGGPIFASRSRVNVDSRDYGIFTATSGQSFLPRIVDGDPESYWQSDTGVDGTEEAIVSSFQVRAALTPASFDILAIQNMNLRRFKVEYKTGAGAYAIVPGTDYTMSDFSGADFLISFAAISADTIRITATHTQGSATNKRIGGVYASLMAVQLTQGHLNSYDKRYREKVRTVVLGDGSEAQEYILRSAASYHHYGATVGLDLCSQAERDAILAIKRVGDPFTWIPEPGDLKREVYTCRMDGPWGDRYYNSFKGAGYTLNLNIKEVGDL